VSVSKGWSTEKAVCALCYFQSDVMQQAETVQVWGDGCLVKVVQKKEQLETTTWLFEDDFRSLPRSRRKLAPPQAAFPIELGTYEYAASADGVDENLFLLLHGLGDSHVPYAKLARTLALPQVRHLLKCLLIVHVSPCSRVVKQQTAAVISPLTIHDRIILYPCTLDRLLHWPCKHRFHCQSSWAMRGTLRLTTMASPLCQHHASAVA
jgi:hypothetical protein